MQDNNNTADEKEEQTDDYSLPKLNRRQMMKASAVAAGAAVVGTTGMSREVEALPAPNPLYGRIDVADALDPARSLSNRIGNTVENSVNGYLGLQKEALDQVKIDLDDAVDEQSAIDTYKTARALEVAQSQDRRIRQDTMNFEFIDDVVLPPARADVNLKDPSTTGFASAAITAIKSGVAVELASGSTQTEAENVGKDRAITQRLAQATGALEQANENYSALAPGLRDTVKNTYHDTLVVAGAGPPTAAPKPTGTIEIAGTSNGSVVAAAPLAVSGSSPEPANLRETPDDYTPEVYLVHSQDLGWVPCAPIQSMPFEFGQYVDATSIDASSARSIVGSPPPNLLNNNPDADPRTAHLAESFKAVADQANSYTSTLINTGVNQYVTAVQDSLDSGTSLGDIVDSRTLVQEYADSSNFSRIAAELAAAGLTTPDDGSLSTAATVEQSGIVNSGIDKTVAAAPNGLMRTTPGVPPTAFDETNSLIYALSGTDLVRTDIETGATETVASGVADLSSDPVEDKSQYVRLSPDASTAHIVGRSYDSSGFGVRLKIVKIDLTDDTVINSNTYDDSFGFAATPGNDLMFLDGYGVAIEDQDSSSTTQYTTVDISGVITQGVGANINPKGRKAYDQTAGGLLYAHNTDTDSSGNPVTKLKLYDQDVWPGAANPANTVDLTANADFSTPASNFTTPNRRVMNVASGGGQGYVFRKGIDDSGDNPSYAYLDVINTATLGFSNRVDLTGRFAAEITDVITADQIGDPSQEVVGATLALADGSKKSVTIDAGEDSIRAEYPVKSGTPRFGMSITTVAGDTRVGMQDGGSLTAFRPASKEFADDDVVNSVSGQLFVDTTIVAGDKDITEGTTFGPTEFSSAYVLNINADTDEYRSVLLTSDDGKLTITDIVTDSEGDTAAQDVTDAASARGSTDATDSSTNTDTTADQYVAIPEPSSGEQSIQELQDRGDFLVQVLDSSGTVLENVKSSDIEYIDTDADGSADTYVVPVSQLYTSVTLRIAPGFKTKRPAKPVINPESTETVKEDVQGLADTDDQIKEESSDLPSVGGAFGGSGSFSDRPILYGLAGATGILALIQLLGR